MAGDFDIPMKIARLDASDAVKQCLAQLWTVELGDSGVGYKAKYVAVISEHIREGNQ
jgi:hypothetical protein